VRREVGRLLRYCVCAVKDTPSPGQHRGVQTVRPIERSVVRTGQLLHGGPCNARPKANLLLAISISADRWQRPLLAPPGGTPRHKLRIPNTSNRMPDAVISFHHMSGRGSCLDGSMSAMAFSFPGLHCRRRLRLSPMPTWWPCTLRFSARSIQIVRRDCNQWRMCRMIDQFVSVDSHVGGLGDAAVGAGTTP
jgi:hypothetical protein